MSTFAIQNIGSCSFANWWQMKNIAVLWAVKTFAVDQTVGSVAEFERDETDASLVLYHGGNITPEEFLEKMTKYDTDGSMMQELRAISEDMDNSGCVILPMELTCPIVEEITGFACKHLVATCEGVYFIEKEP